MKKLISKVLVMAMLLSIFTVPTQAIVDPIDLRIQQFVDGVWSLENRDEFVNMLVLLKNVDDEEGFLEAYTAMFNGLLPGQQDRLNSFGATLKAVEGFGRYFMNEQFSVSNLESYLGLDDGPSGTPANKQAFYDALYRRKAEFAVAVSDVSAETLDKGFARMDKLFDMLKLVQTLQNSNLDVMKYSIRFLQTPAPYGVLTLDKTKAGIIVIAANMILEDDISTSETVVKGVQVLVDYYNLKSNTQDQRRIYDYLSRYGFIEIVVPTPPTPPTPTPTPTPVNTGNTDNTINIDEEAIAESGFAFGDLGKYQWALVAIQQLFSAGVIKGKNSTTFDPSGYVTRAEFAAMLTRMFALIEPESIAEQEAVFTDVKRSDWFIGEVIAAYKGKLVKGFGNDTYAPNSKITREQIAEIIMNVLKEEGLSLPESNEVNSILSDFTDAGTVSNWARLSTATAAKYGIINGVVVGSKKTYEFKKYATRAEVAVMLYRLAAIVDSEVNVVE